ncbi:1,4-alpha-glucan branching protein GlgB [Lachnospiraceae bacterium 62-35]
MDKILYDLMDWAAIEEMVYSEARHPEKILGPHVVDEGLLIQAFIPTAESVQVKLVSTGKTYPMSMADDEGFFAVLLPRKTTVDYRLLVVYHDGAEVELSDPYSFPLQFTENDLKKFSSGIHYQIYEKMGAHPITINGVEGVLFAVWAPCAMRVSVVGDFNMWDGRRHQMTLHEGSGVYELFIPGLKQGDIYKYEIKKMNGDPILKADPYASYGELRPNTASVIWDIDHYQWSDKEWMETRAKTASKKKPMSIYEIHLGSWKRKELAVDEEGKEVIGSEFYNYREIAPDLASYVKEMGYTHVELMPVMEHPLDASWGYQVSGYYAPTSRYGTPDDFMYFMDYMHGQGIGVILDWVPAHFPRDAWGMAAFDGTCVYEHMDPRKGSHPHWGTLIYNYGRPEVVNFLIANALFWTEKYHADGIRMDAVASMLYLDYGKNDGEWVANIYGGHENLEAVEFLKHLNSIFKKRKDGAVLIAEESTAWPKITGDVNDDGLGFDYKWNMGWMNDFLGYMQCDPYFRRHHYGELTFSLLYAYSEDFILVFSHDEVVHGKGSIANKMPGATLEDKYANLRAAYGFMMGHPGKKLLFMGQEFGQMDEWNENASLEWNLLEYPLHRNTQSYVRALNKMYASYPALYEMDYHPNGFEWIECNDWEESIVIFTRKTKKKDETLLFVCNFDTIAYDKYKVGVPFAGKYKEILNSDAEEFGGLGRINLRAKTSKKEEANECPNSITIALPPLSVCVFTCTPNKPAARKTAAKKKEEKKPTAGKTEIKAAETDRSGLEAEKEEIKGETAHRAEIKEAEIKTEVTNEIETKAPEAEKSKVKIKEIENAEKLEVKSEKPEVKAEEKSKTKRAGAKSAGKARNSRQGNK